MAFSKVNFNERLIKIDNLIKNDSTTAYFLFDGEYNKITFDIDSITRYNDLRNLPNYQKVFKKFIFDSTKIKNYKELYRMIDDYEKFRERNYHPLGIYKLILNFKTNNQNSGFLNIDIIDKDIFFMVLQSKTNINRIMQYLIIFNENAEIKYSQIDFGTISYIE